MMSGIGERLGPPVALPEAFAVLANPGIPAPTKQVFEALGLAPGSRVASTTGLTTGGPKANAALTLDALVSCRNDLEAGAIKVAPAIADALERLSRLADARVTRMSGSGATCFALFDNRRSAGAARRQLAADQPGWWVKATVLR